MLYFCRAIGSLLSLGALGLALAGCGGGLAGAPPTAEPIVLSDASTQTAIALIETPTHALTTTPEPTTSCAAPWRQAYGDGEPDVESRIQQALATHAISAAVRSSTFGEIDGCGIYHAAALDVEVSARVSSLADQGTLQALATRIDETVRQIHEQTGAAPSLGRRQITFEADGATCRWDAARGACQP
jgi:hypothetical protein